MRMDWECPRWSLSIVEIRLDKSSTASGRYLHLDTKLSPEVAALDFI